MNYGKLRFNDHSFALALINDASLALRSQEIEIQDISPEMSLT